MGDLRREKWILLSENAQNPYFCQIYLDLSSRKSQSSFSFEAIWLLVVNMTSTRPNGTVTSAELNCLWIVYLSTWMVHTAYLHTACNDKMICFSALWEIFCDHFPFAAPLFVRKFSFAVCLWLTSKTCQPISIVFGCIRGKWSAFANVERIETWMLSIESHRVESNNTHRWIALLHHSCPVCLF